MTGGTDVTPSSWDTEARGALGGRLRTELRRAGLDPHRHGADVRRLAERLVDDHDARSLTGAVLPVADRGGVVESLVQAVSGFGALQAFLDDPEVEEVWVNDPSRVFVARNGRHELTSVILTGTQVTELVERMLAASGRRVDVSQPFVDATLPGGHRLHVVLDGITRGFSAVNIRKYVVRAARLNDLVALGSLTDAGRGVPARLRGGRAQHRRLRLDPGRQDHSSQCPGQLDPGRAAGDQRGGGLRAGFSSP